MAEATYVFDPEVFSFMFDITDVVPALHHVSVEEVFKKIAPGHFVPITIYLVNNTSTPGRSFPMNPSEDPTVTIYGPLDTLILSATAMEQVDTGIYTYVYTTTTSTPLGVYSGIFRAVNGAKEMLSKKYFLFTVI